MTTGETKDNGTKNGWADIGCCNSEDFRKGFEKQFKCFPGQGEGTDFSVMMEGMMKKMMEMCCGSKAEDAGTKTESAKGPEEDRKEKR